MSYCNDIKQEILDARLRGKRQREARALGIVLFARRLNEREVSHRTESEAVARLYRESLRELCPHGAAVADEQAMRRGRSLYSVSLPERKDRLALIERVNPAGILSVDAVGASEICGAFLAGAFLACGNAADPEKGYHLEFSARTDSLADTLLSVLDACVRGARKTLRRGASVVYYKDCGQIEDLLTLMGASKASLAMVEVEIVKQVRNQAMRATNCETANIDKLVRASASQVEDIELVLRERGLQSLSEELRETALLRLENPELSLRELAERFERPVSRSGVHHRLDKISEIARRIREPDEGGGSE